MESAPPTFSEAFLFWLKLGFISFGGPAGQIAIMHAELVERRRWISEERFLHALNFCMLLPGPEAQQLATYAGWLLHIGGRVLKNSAMWALAALAFAGLFFAKLPFPFIVLGAGAIGFLGGNVRPDLFAVLKNHGAAAVVAIGLALWWTPVLAAGAWHGWHGTLFREGLFFSKAAMVTFGGAYAVLPYVSQQAVEQHGWLAPGQMLDGLAFAETTPGPLIMVLQFAGFLGGWNHPGALSPLTAATLGAAITTWTTFVPCFLWIFLGAPYVERLRENVRLTAALSAITAAVVGVILNLAVWFGWRVFQLARGGVDEMAVILAISAFIGLVRWKWNVVWVVVGGAVAGWVWHAAM